MNDAITNMNFEDAMRELETIVKKLESGDESLDNAIASYERGVALKKFCEKKLKDAQMKIEQISISDDGEINLSNFGNIAKEE